MGSSVLFIALLALNIGGEVWNLKSTESRKQETTEDQGWAQPEGPTFMTIIKGYGRHECKAEPGLVKHQKKGAGG